MFSNNNIKDILLKTKKIFAKVALETPYLDAEILLSHVLALTREEIFFFQEYQISSKQMLLLQKSIERRLAGEPISYITGIKEFWNCSFIVSNKVLIPRPETEQIVDTAIKYIKSGVTKKLDDDIRIIDLGTGSGCIAITLAKNLSLKHQVVASDFSYDALTVAEQNAAKNNVTNKVRFILSDWFNKIEGKFDLILSNPPYIAQEELVSLNVAKYEPLIALTDYNDGMSHYIKIIDGLDHHLANNGVVIFEHGYQQRNQLTNLITQSGYKVIECLNDISGLARLISFKRK